MTNDLMFLFVFCFFSLVQWRLKIKCTVYMLKLNKSEAGHNLCAIQNQGTQARGGDQYCLHAQVSPEESESTSSWVRYAEIRI